MTAAAAKNALDLIERYNPGLRQVLQPKRYHIPAGYANTSLDVALSLYAHVSVPVENLKRHTPYVTNAILSMHLAQFQVPIFFLNQNWLDAVALTNLPTNATFSDVHWPLPAMVFALPTEWGRRHFEGYDTRYLMIGHVPKGVYPRNLNQPYREFFDKIINADVQCTQNRVMISFPIYAADGRRVDYNMCHTDDASFNSIVSLPINEEINHIDKHGQIIDAAEDLKNLPSGERERNIVQFGSSLAIKILLAMVSNPRYVEHGTCTRPATKKHGKMRDALWNPNFIGRSYQSPKLMTTPNETVAGTHASPRPHWRCGHFRWQRYGAGRAEINRIWIEPVMVNFK